MLDCGLEGNERPVLSATKGAENTGQKILDDFLSERGEPTQRESVMRTNEVGKSLAGHQKKEVDKVHFLFLLDCGLEGNERPVLSATKGAENTGQKILDDFLSERGEPTQRESVMRTNEVGKSLAGHQKKEVDKVHFLFLLDCGLEGNERPVFSTISLLCIQV